MNNHLHTPPAGIWLTALAAIGIAFLFILLMSLVNEPHRQKINALLIAGAGAVYWSGGLGVWEFVFGIVLLVLAFKGMDRYYFIGLGWLFHTVWDVLHHLYGNPIVYLDSSSSLGCAICDPILAVWFFLGAPTIWPLLTRVKQFVA